MSEQHVSAKGYIGTLVGLLILTVVTVGASQVDLGHAGNIILGLAIAVAKAALVVLFFMQLKCEKRWWAGIVLFPAALVLIIISLNLPDTALNGYATKSEFGQTTKAKVYDAKSKTWIEADAFDKMHEKPNH